MFSLASFRSQLWDSLYKSSLDSSYLLHDIFSPSSTAIHLWREIHIGVISLDFKLLNLITITCPKVVRLRFHKPKEDNEILTNN